MKNSNIWGITAALFLILTCFIPWTFYPDLGKEFTGFFSEGNAYGKPGIVFIVLCVLEIIFFIIPKLWAKRINIFMAALTLAYGVKTYILFSSCYAGICPTRKIGIYLVLILPVAIIVSSLLPAAKKQGKK